ncbi:unnamed protein product, partial [marine sediment metagenome]
MKNIIYNLTNYQTGYENNKDDEKNLKWVKIRKIGEKINKIKNRPY